MKHSFLMFYLLLFLLLVSFSNTQMVCLMEYEENGDSSNVNKVLNIFVAVSMQAQLPFRDLKF